MAKGRLAILRHAEEIAGIITAAAGVLGIGSESLGTWVGQAEFEAVAART
jgi:hypothetical protein